MLLAIQDPDLSKQMFGKKNPRVAQMHQLSLSSNYAQAYITQAGKGKKVE